MKDYKRLIESAMPIKEISAESVRDKSIRHGHISTLHLWWARRPLPVCRAVVFASLVPDPDDENCPKEFTEAVSYLLSPKGVRDHLSKTLSDHTDEYNTDPYKPYEDIPYTSAIDLMDDTPRNRLMMFIGKFSNKFISDQKKGKSTAAKDQLSAFSLIKWNNKNNEEILTIARKLLWVAFDPVNNTLSNFDVEYGKIKIAEKVLFELKDRHKQSGEVTLLEETLKTAISSFQARMPAVFDPFAGGGAIPLEAARLGCRSFGNDLNPVAHIIQRGSLEFPQKYGKPITYSKEEFKKKYGSDAIDLISDFGRIEGNDAYINNRLSFDVEYYARYILSETEKEIGRYYPADENGNKPIAYYWARVGTCSNPSCRAEVPLLKQFYLVNKKDKKIYLKPHIDGKEISFTIEYGNCDEDGWNRRTNLVCPVCGSMTDSSTLKAQFKNNTTSERLLAVIQEGESSKNYRLPSELEVNVIDKLPDVEDFRPNDMMQVGNNRNFNTPGWGVDNYGQMFSRRQLLLMHTLVEKLGELKQKLNPKGLELDDYSMAVVTYLGIWIDRISIINTTFGRWHVSGEKIEHPFSRQAIPMMFDYPESNPFCSQTGSALNMLNWVVRYIESESDYSFFTESKNASSGDKEQFSPKSLNAVITDPPYYDAIAYADLSDFFYVWLKRTLGDVYPLNFAFPQTPKTEECTALKHHHENDADEAKIHFENKLMQIFKAVEHQTDGVVSIMFAHQSTDAWTTLCNSVLGADMNISGSWAIGTELGNRMIAMDKAALESSVTVSCRPSNKEPFGDYQNIRKDIDHSVKEQVYNLYNLGFRGADLLTACFGQAVREFGRYQLVEKKDGTEVTVGELLEYTRDAAFNAIISDIDTDEITRFYIGWLNLYGFTEASHDDVTKISQIGLNIDLGDLISRNIIVRNGNKNTISGFKNRTTEDKNIGTRKTEPMLDKVHRAFRLYALGNRRSLLVYLNLVNAVAESPFWRVVNALSEVLPQGCEDSEPTIGLLQNQESLILEMKTVVDAAIPQQELGF